MSSQVIDSLKKRKALIDTKADAWAKTMEYRTKIKLAQDEIKTTISEICQEISKKRTNLILKDKDDEILQMESLKSQLASLENVLDRAQASLAECTKEMVNVHLTEVRTERQAQSLQCDHQSIQDQLQELAKLIKEASSQK